MENLYTTEKKKACELIKAQPETIKFLLDYSKSLSIIECGELKFENIAN